MGYGDGVSSPPRKKSWEGTVPLPKNVFWFLCENMVFISTLLALFWVTERAPMKYVLLHGYASAFYWYTIIDIIIDACHDVIVSSFYRFLTWLTKILTVKILLIVKIFKDKSREYPYNICMFVNLYLYNYSLALKNWLKGVEISVSEEQLKNWRGWNWWVWSWIG